MKLFPFAAVSTLVPILCLSASGIGPIPGNTEGWNVATDNSVYQIQVQAGRNPFPQFWGARPAEGNGYNLDRSRRNGPFRLDEIPVRGHYADKTPILEAVFRDGTRDIELEFIAGEVTEADGRETLALRHKDKYYPLEVTSYIRVLPEYDIIEKWLEVRNTSTDKKDDILIENLMSGSVSLPSDRYYLTHHSGQWYREFMLRRTELTAGIKSLRSRDFFAFNNTPWFAVTNSSGNADTGAEVWFGHIQYSGNWDIAFDVTHSNHLQIAAGINFWDTSLTLGAGESYTTPKLILGYTAGGTERAAQLMHDYVRGEVLPAPSREKIRPVLYNSWYATAFDVNEEQQVALAKAARDLGVELFVIDDGWFRGRTTDKAGLGDWVVDTVKFSGGLQSMIAKINDLGLDFGIWVEPEMVNPDSDLYRRHPDWVLGFPHRDKTEWRNQLTLNLAREDVYQYLLQSMTDLLSANNIKFVKWDRNRGLTQPGWPSAPKELQREGRLRYIDNLYRLIDALRERFPGVIFENCSSGGGRPDLGMLGRMEQTWTSDNTDPIDRLFIQYGYLSAFPANTMVCWTNDHFQHQAGQSLDFVFDAAMQGVLGIGQDITRWNEQQKTTAKRKIAQYKELRELIQLGKVDRLRSPFEGDRVAVQYTARDRTGSVVFCYNLSEMTEGASQQSVESKRLKFRSLDPGGRYRVEGDGNTYTGSYLMEIGVSWPVKGAYRSAIVKVSVVK